MTAEIPACYEIAEHHTTARANTASRDVTKKAKRSQRLTDKIMHHLPSPPYTPVFNVERHGSVKS